MSLLSIDVTLYILLSGCRAVEVKASFVQGSGLFASTLEPFKTSSIRARLLRPGGCVY